jgi:hypothetical protein
LPVSLATALREEARREGAILHITADRHTKEALAALTHAAQHVQQLSPRHQAEAARWAPAPRSRRRDGVPHTA